MDSVFFYQIKAVLRYSIFAFALLGWCSPDTFSAVKSKRENKANPTVQSKSFSFVVWGHPKRGDGKIPLHFEEILERIEELKADFLVVTGDVINGMWGKPADPEIIRADWERFDQGVKRLELPIYRIPGNHDVHNFVTRDIYLERYSKPPYAISYHRSRLIFLDTVGIDQRTEDGQPDWHPQKLPFDEVQLKFIRQEIAKQAKYDHVFFFMHHVHGWREPNGYWWKDVHPLIINGKTRAVFSGTPGNPAYKYDYIKQDNIHYISSCTFPTRSIKAYKLEKKKGVKTTAALNHQPDNLQFVRVEGHRYTIKTIVVGEWQTPSLSSRFWSKVEQPFGRRERIGRFIKDTFSAIRRFSWGNVIWGGIGFIAGVLLIYIWQRNRSKRKFSLR